MPSLLFLALDITPRRMEWVRAPGSTGWVCKGQHWKPASGTPSPPAFSLEEELNRNANMDVKIVILSHLAMFFYVSLTLGNGTAVRDEDRLFTALRKWVIDSLKPLTSSSISSSTHSIDSRNTPLLLPRLPRGTFIRSRVILGFFGISLVILLVASSVDLFSAIGFEVTLIFADVIPFLVLAAGR